MDDFWVKVKSLLKKGKMSQETLSEKIQISKYTLYSWIRNNTYPSVDVAVKIAKILGTTVEKLVESEKKIRILRPDTVLSQIEDSIKEYRGLNTRDVGEIQWETWMKNAINAFQIRNNLSTFSETVCYLIESDLNHRGFFRTDYQPGIQDEIISPEDNKGGKSDQEKVG